MAAFAAVVILRGAALALPDITAEYDGVPLASGASAMVFSPMGLDEFAFQNLVIRNDGNTTLGSLSASMVGANAGDFALSSIPVSLAPGASVGVTVAFSPSGFGSRTATLSIASNDSDENPFLISLSGLGLDPIESWRQFYFGSHQGMGNGADTADPDQDGISNLLEFACCTDPLVNEIERADEQSGVPLSCGLPVIRMPTVSGDAPRVIFLRRKDALAAGVTYLPVFSDNLADWEASEEPPSVVADEFAFEIVSVPYPVMPTESHTCFFRLQITREE